MDFNKDYFKAARLGRLAFINKIAKAPCQDKKMMELLEPYATPISSKDDRLLMLLKAWNSGFHYENLTVVVN